jgi:hypothetical protein
MTIFEGNISALKRIHPNFIIPENAPSDSKRDVEVLAARTGDPTAQSKGMLLHSRLDPRREARRLIADAGTNDCAVFFGFGLGYYIEEYLALYPDATAIVVEPDPALFKIALEVRDLTGVLASSKVSFLLDVQPDTLAALLNTHLKTAVSVVAPRSIVRLNEEYFARLQAVIDAFAARREINKNTLKRFGKRWVRNLAANLHCLPAAGRLHSLSGRLEGLPALLLAAGPSLDSILVQLPALAERFVIFAVDTSLRAALNAGVTPDFLVVVDPQYWNVRHLDGCGTENTILITESATYPAVFKRRYKAMFLGASLFPLGSFLERELGDFGKLGAGGSVATSAWDTARQLGCSPIYTAGLDLGYPAGNTHFRGGRFEDFQMCQAGRFNPAEKGRYDMINDAEPFFVESNSKGQVRTDKRLITYKWWFENQLKMYAGLQCGNLSENGVKIEGMNYHPMEDLLGYQKINRSATPLPTLADFTAHETESHRRQTLESAVDELLDDLASLQSIATQACSLARRLQPVGGNVDAKVLDALDRIDSELLSHKAKDVVGFLVQDFAQDILDDKTGDTTAEEINITSLRMYERLRESAEYHITILNAK